MKKRALNLPTTNTDNVATKANQLANFPLNFLRTGNYFYDNGGMYNRTVTGYWWSAIRGAAAGSYDLHTTASAVDPQSNNYRGGGYAVRCGAGRLPREGLVEEYGYLLYEFKVENLQDFSIIYCDE